jgi:hypothetical protein
MAPVMHLCGDTKLVTDLLQLSIPSLQKTSNESSNQLLFRCLSYLTAWFGDTPFEHPFSHNTPLPATCRGSTFGNYCRTCYRYPDVSNGYMYHFVYLYEFFTALQATHGSDGVFLFFSMD